MLKMYVKLSESGLMYAYEQAWTLHSFRRNFIYRRIQKIFNQERLIWNHYQSQSADSQYYKVRPCVSIRLSEIQVISQNFRENKKLNILVHFCIAFPYQQGFPFKNFWSFLNILKVSKVRNHCLKRPYKRCPSI